MMNIYVHGYLFICHTSLNTFVNVWFLNFFIISEMSTEFKSRVRAKIHPKKVAQPSGTILQLTVETCEFSPVPRHSMLY